MWMCKQQMRLAYSAVYHTKMRIIKLQLPHHANLFFISSLLKHFTAECAMLLLYIFNADILVW